LEAFLEFEGDTLYVELGGERIAFRKCGQNEWTVKPGYRVTGGTSEAGPPDDLQIERTLDS